MSLQQSKTPKEDVGDSRVGRIENDIAAVDKELRDIEHERQRLLERRELLRTKRKTLTEELNGLHEAQQSRSVSADWDHRRFPWYQHLVAVLGAKWRGEFRDFRFCQLPVVNAAIARRDLFVVMPTGAGKSLCYQIPGILRAISGFGVNLINPVLSTATKRRYTTGSDRRVQLSPEEASQIASQHVTMAASEVSMAQVSSQYAALTVVISPLISLMQDQVLDLQERGVKATLLSSQTDVNDAREINNNLDTYLFLYVTPERIVKSKRLISKLEKLYNADKLDRFVIDEAHCCSQLGHDFRPDYKKLGLIRTIFPNVPIIAVSATCPRELRDDVISILNMPPISSTGTIFFESSLRRPNLSYQVLSKPKNDTLAHLQMLRWIQKYHPNECGIVYCLTQKDTEQVALFLANPAKELQNSNIDASNVLPIKGVGIYHASMEANERSMVHRMWREGKVKVVVATIAFGLGINQPNVRFVIHNTLSKSVEGYYQESGRAGRDGKPSDCVLFYRPSDIFRVSSIVVTEPKGMRNVYEMARYCVSSCTSAAAGHVAMNTGGMVKGRTSTARVVNQGTLTVPLCRVSCMEAYFGQTGEMSQTDLSSQTCGACDLCQLLKLNHPSLKSLSEPINIYSAIVSAVALIASFRTELLVGGMGATREKGKKNNANRLTLQQFLGTIAGTMNIKTVEQRLKRAHGLTKTSESLRQLMLEGAKVVIDMVKNKRLANANSSSEMDIESSDEDNLNSIWADIIVTLTIYNGPVKVEVEPELGRCGVSFNISHQQPLLKEEFHFTPYNTISYLEVRGVAEGLEMVPLDTIESSDGTDTRGLWLCNWAHELVSNTFGKVSGDRLTREQTDYQQPLVFYPFIFDKRSEGKEEEEEAPNHVVDLDQTVVEDLKVRSSSTGSYGSECMVEEDLTIPSLKKRPRKVEMDEMKHIPEDVSLVKDDIEDDDFGDPDVSIQESNYSNTLDKTTSSAGEGPSATKRRIDNNVILLD